MLLNLEFEVIKTYLDETGIAWAIRTAFGCNWMRIKQKS